MKERNWKYKINGGWPTLIMASVMLAIFGGITVWLYTTRNGAFIGGLIVTACMAIGFILSVCSVLFFKVFVDKDGFFCQTAPGNGRYYRYSEIRNMWLSSGRETNARQPTYCNFETVEGKRMRFLVLGSQIDAVDYMIERVESMGNKSGEDDLDWEIVITGKKEAGFVVNQRIIAGNAQFTGIAAGRGVGFTTGLLLLRKGLGMRETPIRPHSWHCRMQSGYQYGGNRKRPPVWRRHRGSLRPRGRNLGGVEGMTGGCGSGCDPAIHTRRLRVYHRPRRLRMASRISIFFAARRFEPLNSMG